jgi:hypothetical protein
MALDFAAACDCFSVNLRLPTTSQSHADKVCKRHARARWLSYFRFSLRATCRKRNGDNHLTRPVGACLLAASRFLRNAKIAPLQVQIGSG